MIASVFWTVVIRVALLFLGFGANCEDPHKNAGTQKKAFKKESAPARPSAKGHVRVADKERHHQTIATVGDVGPAVIDRHREQERAAPGSSWHITTVAVATATTGVVWRVFDSRHSAVFAWVKNTACCAASARGRRKGRSTA
jgi:hypothetical protein